jgi:hypothetical protein
MVLNAMISGQHSRCVFDDLRVFCLPDLGWTERRKWGLRRRALGFVHLGNVTIARGCSPGRAASPRAP